jgi:hypothetical protein
MKNNCGIYKFINLINNKIYIGSSNNLIKRKRDHLNLNIKSGCSLFRKAIIKYGISNFEFEILEYVKDENKLFEREQYYLDTLLKAQDYINNISNFFLQNGYNLSPTAKGRRGVKELNVSHKYKKIIEYDNQGNFIKIWDSIQEASKFHNINKTRISKSCIKEERGKFIFRYYTDNYSWKINFKKRKPKKSMTKDVKLKISNTLKGRESLRKKKVKQMDLQGNIIKTFPSITEASKITNISLTSISNVLNGNSKTAGKYLWEI